METRLKEVRTEKGFSQEELAEKSGISRTIISGLENGKVECVTTNTMRAIAQALGCRVSDIFSL